MRVVGGMWRGRPLQAPSGRGTRPTSDKVREAMFDVLGSLPELRAAVARASSAAAAAAPPERTAALGGPGEQAAACGVPGAAGSLAGHAVLDLFAGSGALGIEALSRGAASCTFVEAAPPALHALRGNLARLGVHVAGGREARPRPPRSGCESADLHRGEAGGPSAVVRSGDVRRVLAADARRGEGYTLVFADPPYGLYEQVRPALARLLGRVLVPGAVLVVESAAGMAPGLPWPVVRDKRYGDTRVTFLVAEAAAPAEGEAAD